MKNFWYLFLYMNMIYFGVVCGLFLGVFDYFFLCCCCLILLELFFVVIICVLYVEIWDRIDLWMFFLVICCFLCLFCGYLFWVLVEFFYGYCILFGCCWFCFGFLNFWVFWVGWGFVVWIFLWWSCCRIIECLEFYVVGL